MADKSKQPAAPAETAADATPAIAEEPAEFPVSLEEFLSEVSTARVEMKAGFTHLCRSEQITGHKQRSEWQKLLTLFETRPIAVPWSEWQKQEGK